MNDDGERDRIEARLRRLDELIGDLGRITDPVAREHVRELFETLLDSHSVALARVIARLARAPGGAAALAELSGDPQVRPILLLHGLHPDDLHTRLREAVAALREEGIGIALGRVGNRSATVWIDEDGSRDQVEAALYEAAPDLEGIVFDSDDRAALASDLAATLAG